MWGPSKHESFKESLLNRNHCSLKIDPCLSDQIVAVAQDNYHFITIDWYIGKMEVDEDLDL